MIASGLRVALPFGSLLIVSSLGVAQAQAAGDITALCGDKPARVALVDGFGGNTWRKTTYAEFEDEASKCANITEVIHTVADGDQQKYNSDINSLVAQGVDIIVAMTDFGIAPMPAYRAAVRDGAIMVPYHSQLPGEAGKDFSANTYLDAVSVAQQMADWFGASVKSGNVVFFGGWAGSDSSSLMFEAFKERLQTYPDLKLLEDRYIVTNWTPADSQKAAAGLIAKYPEIDGIAADFSGATMGAIKAFEAANLKVPAMAVLASSNELGCTYLQRREQGNPFNYIAFDGTNGSVRMALRAGMAQFEGVENTEPNRYQTYIFADSLTGVDPKCDPNAPPDADLSTSLPEDKLMKLFGR